MTWPEIGKPLPRIDGAYVRPEKWSWILGDEAHGPHWRVVFRTVDPDWVWAAIQVQLTATTISGIRSKGPFGLTCEVQMELVLNDRTATVLTAWHYDHEDAAPRLVSAYPRT